MTTVVSLAAVVVPSGRQRKEFDEGKIQELIASIEEKGLMHAIVVRGEPGAETFELVAGERRFRAISELAEFEKGFRYDGKKIEPGFVPVTNLGELTPLEAKEAELEENIRREDLTWQERITAEAELVALRQKKAESRGEPAPKISDLTEEIRGKSTPKLANSIAQSVALAKNLHRPEVAKAKSVNEAVKAMKRVEEAERNAELAAKLGKEHISSKHTLVQGNCIEWMKGQETEQFDVICSDPPYGMGADEFGDSGVATAGAHFYTDDYQSWKVLINEALPWMTALAKPDAHMYLFCDIDRFHELRKIASECGWNCFRTPLIWFKPGAFRAPWPEHGPQRKYECILYARRGELKCNSLQGDVIMCPPDVNLGHPAQKPVELISNLLSRSVRPGMKVLDPFCGSGPIFEAGHSLSAIVTGVEMDAAAAGIAAGRLERLKGK